MSSGKTVLSFNPHPKQNLQNWCCPVPCDFLAPFLMWCMRRSWSSSSNIRSTSLDYLIFSLKRKACSGSILKRSSILSFGNLRCDASLCRDTGADFVLNSTNSDHQIAPINRRQIIITSISCSRTLFSAGGMRGTRGTAGCWILM